MRWTLATLLAAAALAGCGDDGAPARAVTVPVGEAIRVKGDEYSFDPGRVVAQGAPSKLNLALVNEGSLAHNIRVLDGDRDLGGVGTIPGGESRSATVKVSPGSYRLVCTVGDHEQLGMKASLEVGG